MFLVLVLSVLVPAAAVTLLIALRGRLPKLRTDARGIALQTVIVMVVLLAIAGAVAAVLFARADTAIEDLEDTEETDIDLTEINSEALCKAQGGDWAIHAPLVVESCDE